MAGSKCLCPSTHGRYCWYMAQCHTMHHSVSQQRHTVSCSFTMTGPQGTGILHLKAVRNGVISAELEKGYCSLLISGCLADTDTDTTRFSNKLLYQT
ncbi:hypothetical protein YC2023_106078 [Brassica napus]